MLLWRRIIRSGRDVLVFMLLNLNNSECLNNYKTWLTKQEEERMRSSVILKQQCLLLTWAT